MAEKINRRDQIIELIETGAMTKAEIAEKIGIKVTGVSSQLTYLRWMGKFIIFDAETKILSFTDEDGYAEWEAEKKSNRKTKSTTTRTPQEQFDAVTKTIASQIKLKTKWESKLDLMQAEDYVVEDDTLIPEAEANITLLGIKLIRNEEKLADINVDDLEVEEAEEAEETGREDELL